LRASICLSAAPPFQSNLSSRFPQCSGGRLSAKGLIDAGNDVGRARIGKRIVDQFALPSGVDHPLMAQTGKQLTRCRLRQLGSFRQITNRFWTSDEMAKDHQPSGVRQSLEEVCRLLGTVGQFIRHKPERCRVKCFGWLRINSQIGSRFRCRGTTSCNVVRNGQEKATLAKTGCHTPSAVACPDATSGSTHWTPATRHHAGSSCRLGSTQPPWNRAAPGISAIS
jgi:hypothetical protein